tara:strand:+ start:15750 stop:17120 length:1371 start_codon:yes stop_codon:yes gene_type:complete
MLYGTSRLQNYSKNKFRLLPTSASTLGAFGIIQVPIVQGTIVDLASLKLQMKVSATGSSASGVATDEIYARLPADVSSLIQRVEVLVNGVLVNGSSSDYGSCARLRKLCMGTFDRDQSIDRAVSHASISAADANETSEVVMKDWLGTLFAGGEEGASCRFLHTGLCGDITLRIQLGGNNVLVGKQQGQAINANYTTPEAIANAKLMTYKVEDIKFSIEAVSMPDDYEVLLMKDLMAGSLEVGYEEMYSFPLQNITGDSFENRFSVSTRSLNQLYAGVRDSNFQTTGIRAHLMDNVVGDAIVSNAYRFRAYPDPAKQLAWQFSVNNQKHPNYPADLLRPVPILPRWRTATVSRVVVISLPRLSRSRTVWLCSPSPCDTTVVWLVWLLPRALRVLTPAPPICLAPLRSGVWLLPRPTPPRVKPQSALPWSVPSPSQSLLLTQASRFRFLSKQLYCLII